MHLYGYSEEGLYTGQVQCQKDPMRPGQFLRPSQTTELEPPTPAEGQRAKFENGAWLLEDDPNYDIQQQEIVDQSYDDLGVLTKEIVNRVAVDRDPQAIATDRNTVLELRMRSERDGKILAVEWMRERHKDELELGAQTSLTAQEYSELLTYINDLRNVPENTVDLNNPAWPTPPSFV